MTADEIIDAQRKRIELLEGEIRYAVTQVGDRLCWLDVYVRLAKMIGIEFDPLMIPTERFLGNCQRYEASLRTGCRYEEDATTVRIEELEAKVRELEAQLVA